MRTIERIWLSRSWKAVLLLPVSTLFGALSALRRKLYHWGWLKTTTLPVPVVVVGNLSVGGTGKSPVIQMLARELSRLGWTPGIVARGYGGDTQSSPLLLDHQSTPTQVGDEPVMHFQQLGIPVCVCTHRALAAQMLVDKADCTMILSDDGLQHYGLNRDAEIVVFDEHAGIGNGWLLPAGPLRESLSRLRFVDLVLVKRSVSGGGGTLFNKLRRILSTSSKIESFTLSSNVFQQLHTGEDYPLDYFSGKEVHAVAGIGRPSQFFDQLRALDLKVIEHPFNDHHRFTSTDFSFGDHHPVVITAKDAVKARELGEVADNLYILEVTASLTEALITAIRDISNQLKRP